MAPDAQDPVRTSRSATHPKHAALREASPGYQEWFAATVLEAEGDDDAEYFALAFADWALISASDAPKHAEWTAAHWQAEYEHWNS